MSDGQSPMLEWLKSLFAKIPNAGLLLDTPQVLSALPRHELFAGGGAVVDWKTLVPPFRYQGSSYWCTAFSGATIGYLFEQRENGTSPLFSPVELFYRSGGSVWGNSLLNVAQSMQESLVLETDVPTPVPVSWGQAVYESYRNSSRATPEQLVNGKRYAIKKPAIVGTDHASLRAALATSPVMLAIGIGRGYFTDPAPHQTSYSAYHAVVLLDIDSQDCPVIFDSLTQKRDFNGIHRLDADYEILYALSFIDLPDNWQTLQSKVSIPSSTYGKPRVLAREQQVAAHFSNTLKTHPTLAGLAGKYWLSLVNALAYGGYTETDLLNHLTNIRRTGKPIFDLMQPR